MVVMVPSRLVSGVYVCAAIWPRAGACPHGRVHYQAHGRVCWLSERGALFVPVRNIPLVIPVTYVCFVIQCFDAALRPFL
jgi:hypothetical protein